MQYAIVLQMISRYDSPTYLITANKALGMTIITEHTLTAFEDHNGFLGWAVAELDGTFNSEYDACDGRLLAHDLLEHNLESNLTGLTNELEALGAAHWVRGQRLELDSDLLFMCRNACHEEIDAPLVIPADVDYDFTNFVMSAAKSISTEIDLEYTDTEQRKSVSLYLRHAATHMQNGYNWAEKRYQDTQAFSLSADIEKLCPVPEFPGEQCKCIINESDVLITFIDHYELFDDIDE